MNWNNDESACYKDPDSCQGVRVYIQRLKTNFTEMQLCVYVQATMLCLQHHSLSFRVKGAAQTSVSPTVQTVGCVVFFLQEMFINTIYAALDQEHNNTKAFFFFKSEILEKISFE